MDAMGGFLAMGGYGAFVWPAYGIAAVVLGGLTLTGLRRLRRSEAALSMLADSQASSRTSVRDSAP
ncbi:MAG: heme exporter protein CcmD [Alphaproteobacteria bacterium]|nr:heme exporter protein CcmD [Alphaproteobacteria bacterium]